MTQDEVKYINYKKFVDEFNGFCKTQQGKGVLTGIKEAFAQKKRVSIASIYRRIKFVEEYEKTKN